MAVNTSCPFCSGENTGTAVCSACGAQVSDTLLPGTSLQGGLYSIEEELGHGGAAITYRGRDVRLGRMVAIKELYLDGSTRRGTSVYPPLSESVADYKARRELFLEEARVLASFDHPSIVDVYGWFEENNTAYMVMRLLHGRSLLELVDARGPLPETEAVDYIVQVGEALELMHEASTLHRDLKPDNIVLTRTGEAVLIDFGTARTFVDGKTGQMTRFLTPGYAPFEQYGEAARFGPYTDVYALGATLYHLLIGQRPIAATDRAMGAPLRPPRQVKPGVSGAVNNAVMWALEMRVDRRPQSVRQLLDALRPGRDPPVPNSKPDYFVNPVVLISTGILFCVLLGFLFADRGGSGTQPPAAAGTAGVATAPPGAVEPSAPSAANPPQTGPAAPTAASDPWSAASSELDAAWGHDWPRSVAILDSFLAGAPGHPEATSKLYAALIELGKSLIGGGDAANGVRHLQRAQSLMPGRGDATAALAALTPTAVPPAPTPVPPTPVPPPPAAVPPAATAGPAQTARPTDATKPTAGTVRVATPGTPTAPPVTAEGSFTLGSTVAQVAAVQGQPTSISSIAMYYGTSRISLSLGKVDGWSVGDVPLKARR